MAFYVIVIGLFRNDQNFLKSDQGYRNSLAFPLTACKSRFESSGKCRIVTSMFTQEDNYVS